MDDLFIKYKDGTEEARTPDLSRVRRALIPAELRFLVFSHKHYCSSFRGKKQGYFMAKLYFRYGAMGSSKTANALMVHYNYIERGLKALLLKPKLENRDGESIIKSRIGLEHECRFVEDFIEDIGTKWSRAREFDAIVVDEAQFLTEEQVDWFSEVVDLAGIPVICYGLRTDFMSKVFPGSKRLLEIADKIEEVKTVCWCGRKATNNARISGGKIVRSGDQVFMGGNESYTALCRMHFKLGFLSYEDEKKAEWD